MTFMINLRNLKVFEFVVIVVIHYSLDVVWNIFKVSLTSADCISQVHLSRKKILLLLSAL